jgi:hypothetical protein
MTVCLATTINMQLPLETYRDLGTTRVTYRMNEKVVLFDQGSILIQYYYSTKRCFPTIHQNHD